MEGWQTGTERRYSIVCFAIFPVNMYYMEELQEIFYIIFACHIITN